VDDGTLTAPAPQCSDRNPEREIQPFSTGFVDSAIIPFTYGQSGRLIMLLYPFPSTGAGVYIDPICFRTALYAFLKTPHLPPDRVSDSGHEIMLYPFRENAGKKVPAAPE
jgi:hypothetical protein